MWSEVLYALQDKMVMVCTVLAFLIPFMMNLVNERMHEAGDPAWKKGDKEK